MNVRGTPPSFPHLEEQRVLAELTPKMNHDKCLYTL